MGPDRVWVSADLPDPWVWHGSGGAACPIIGPLGSLCHLPIRWAGAGCTLLALPAEGWLISGLLGP